MIYFSRNPSGDPSLVALADSVEILVTLFRKRLQRVGLYLPVLVDLVDDQLAIAKNRQRLDFDVQLYQSLEGEAESAVLCVVVGHAPAAEDIGYILSETSAVRQLLLSAEPDEIAVATEAAGVLGLAQPVEHDNDIECFTLRRAQAIPRILAYWL